MSKVLAALSTFQADLSANSLWTDAHQKLANEAAKEYQSIDEDSTFLSYIEGAGVDNWDGYEIAQQMREDSENE